MGNVQPSDIVTMFNTLKNRYDDLMNELYIGFQKNFLEGMSQHWTCGEAVRYFNSVYKTEIDSLFLAINYSFQDVFFNINYFAYVYFLPVGINYTSQQFYPDYRTIDASMVLSNINGFCGIDKEDAQHLVSLLSNVVSAADICLRDMEQYSMGLSVIDVNLCLPTYFSNMRVNINNAVANVVNSINIEINNTLNRYEDCEGRIKAMFDELSNK